ncbi:MAG: hypothetical protein HQ551_13235, partial [Desulfobacteraceae bacterium]|nr:hypothetical protein [Desulfobacteraceae bacterium]
MEFAQSRLPQEKLVYQSGKRDGVNTSNVQNNAINKKPITYRKSILMSLNKRIIPGFAALLLFFSALPAASLDTVVIKSKSMQKKPKAVIVLPDAYQNSKSGFPVLYLLHGWSGAYDDWANKMDLGPLSDRHSIIIVCPDGGYAGWYIDSPLKKDSQYETYISGEVVRYIDKHYRTIADTEGRFICGLSMGGHRAISLLAKHTYLYAA